MHLAVSARYAGYITCIEVILTSLNCHKLIKFGHEVKSIWDKQIRPIKLKIDDWVRYYPFCVTGHKF